MCIMFLMYNFFFLTLFTIVNCSSHERHIKIDQGILTGIKEKTTFAFTDYTSFKGVPYAEPCVGPRKFDVCIKKHVLLILSFKLSTKIYT